MPVTVSYTTTTTQGLFQELFKLLGKAVQSDLVRQIEYLRVENQVLRSKLGQRVQVSPSERRRLIRFGRVLGTDLKRCLSIVSYNTFQRWVRESQNIKPVRRKRRGRPRTLKEIEALILQLDPEVLAWLKEALHASMKDERDYHSEAIQKLQQDYQHLQERLDALYVDKLDRKVAEATYLRLSERWRGEQEDLRRTLERHEKANRSYVDLGVQLLELASNAHTLYEQQPMLERRRLLNYAFSNCTWKEGRLTVTFRQPFDILADTNRAYQTEKAASGSADGLSEKWLPGTCSIRTVQSPRGANYKDQP